MLFNDKKIIVVIEGPSGVGKDTIIKELIKMSPKLFVKAPSTATRNMRDGESEGSPYFFVSKYEFEQKIATGEIFEHTIRHGEYRGMSKSVFEEIFEKGQIPLKDCDNIGLDALHNLYGNKVLSIFITAKKEDVKERLFLRGDSEEDIKERLLDYDKIMLISRYYDYIVENDILEDCVNKIYKLIEDFYKICGEEKMSNGLTFRKIEVQDAENMQKLIKEMHKNLEDQSWFLPISEHLNDVKSIIEDKRFYILGAFDGKRLAGISSIDYDGATKLQQKIIFPKKYHSDKTVELAFNIVAVAYRGMGLMYKMCCKIVDKLKCEGYEIVCATVHPNNIPSKKTLIKLGFDIIGEVPVKETVRNIACLDLKDGKVYALER